jgi:hypothetical protein
VPSHLLLPPPPPPLLPPPLASSTSTMQRRLPPLSSLAQSRLHHPLTCSRSVIMPHSNLPFFLLGCDPRDPILSSNAMAVTYPSHAKVIMSHPCQAQSYTLSRHPALAHAATEPHCLIHTMSPPSYASHSTPPPSHPLPLQIGVAQRYDAPPCPWRLCRSTSLVWPN